MTRRGQIYSGYNICHLVAAGDERKHDSILVQRKIDVRLMPICILMLHVMKGG